MFGGMQSLFYKAFPINVAFIRGTTADPDGNVTMEKESLLLENLSIAMAAKNSGGYVICQVERIAQEGSLDSRQVKIPGVMVDCVVVAEPEHDMQTYGTQYDPAYSGEIRIPLQTLDPLVLDEKKVIARRAALELAPNSVINLGIGLPDCVGAVAREEKVQDVLYITERCVFRLSDSGLELTEVAPGIDIERDIVSKMPFAPQAHDPVEMDAGIFRPEPMGLRDRLLDIHIDDRISYDTEKNTLFLNFAGMRVRNEADLAAIKQAVDGTLAPLGKRVHSIVNYERFVADDDISDKYMDLVRYVEEKYYISVSRYTGSGFLRLKLGKELGKRKVSSKVYKTSEEAALHLSDK
ncbi:MAG: hypothetical protein BMS9Abin01_0998 [Gammaproteobacteria bacterium]|nr:MAG: hypothetical protein BMS9Abin01_0998 [Gammaproteobacteria bacterium]